MGGHVHDQPPPYSTIAPFYGSQSTTMENIPLHTEPQPGWNMPHYNASASINTIHMYGPTHPDENLSSIYKPQVPNSMGDNAYLCQNAAVGAPTYPNPMGGLADSNLYPASSNRYNGPSYTNQYPVVNPKPHSQNTGGIGTSVVAPIATGYLLGSLCGLKCCRCFPCCCCYCCDSSCSSCISVSSCVSCC